MEIFKTKLDNSATKTIQPPYSNMGISLALPVGTHFSSGFGIKHVYTYPRLNATVNGDSYDIKEEETVFTIPVAIGLNPKLSIGASSINHLGENQMSFPDGQYYEGNSIRSEIMAGALVKISPSYRIGLTYLSTDIYSKLREKKRDGKFYNLNATFPHVFRFGTAMYPLKWFFFFADLQYDKYPDYQFQPGFHLGVQLTYYGKLLFPFTSEFGMLPLYLGYSHQPYDRINNTQQKYFSLGTGYYLNNIYLQWALRINTGSPDIRTIVIGSEDNTLRLDQYRNIAPLFFCIGYRF